MDAFLAILNNPAILTILPIAWGLVCKYHPAWKNVPNAIIPYVTAVVAFIVKVFAPEEAHAGALLAALPLSAAGGILGHAAQAGWQAIFNSLVYEVFLRHPANAVLAKPR